MNKMFFVDFEASDYAGYPIEIGWAVLDLGDMAVSSKSLLIKPTDFWIEHDDLWSDRAEQVHGISMERLMAEGLDVAEVCGRVDAVLGEESAYSDNQSYDSRWADMLYQEAERPRPWRCKDVEQLYAGIDKLVLRNSIQQAHKLVPEFHRADKDAERLAWVWYFVLHGGG